MLETYQSVDYYSFMFFIAMLLQEHVKDFLSTLVCLFMSTASEYVMELYQAWGCNYWESAMFFEASLFCVSIFLIGTRLGWLLFFVTTVSFFISFIGYIIPSGDFYTWYRESYGIINIIMFEILFWGCLVSSRLRPFINKTNKYSEKFLQERIRLWKKDN